jgi:hypothetical protein
VTDDLNKPSQLESDNDQRPDPRYICYYYDDFSSPSDSMEEIPEDHLPPDLSLMNFFSLLSLPQRKDLMFVGSLWQTGLICHKMEFLLSLILFSTQSYL